MTTTVSRRNHVRRVMIFDVETTGLIPKKVKGQPPPSLASLPHILQLSFIIFDTKTWRPVKSFDTYIRVESEIAISPFISELTGITREKCDSQGVPIAHALSEFYREFMQCDCFVAHNLEFDKEMIQIEMRRNSAQLAKNCPYVNLVFNAMYEKMHNIEIFCTMRVGRNICKIPFKTQSTNASHASSTSTSTSTKWKSPKLSELYEFLFGEVPKNLHNSLVDTYVCLRCFVKLRFRFDIGKHIGFGQHAFKFIKMKLTDAQAEHISQISSSSSTPVLPAPLSGSIVNC